MRGRGRPRRTDDHGSRSGPAAPSHHGSGRRGRGRPFRACRSRTSSYSSTPGWLFSGSIPAACSEGWTVDELELGTVKAGEGAGVLEQVVPVTDLGDLAPLEHDDPVGASERAQAMGDRDRGPTPDQVVERLLDL